MNISFDSVRLSLRSLPSPEPAAGIDAYKLERDLALAADPRRMSNYARYLAATRGSADLDYLPIKLDIENVSRCNYKCIMCVVTDWPKGKRAEDMPLDSFRKLIDDQYGLVEIKLQGIGEPLLQRGELFEMIRYARSKHIWVRTTTNASLLHLNNNHRNIIDSDVNELQISIDGATADVFETIRGGSVFRQVIKNCELVNSYCKELNVERTKMWTVVQAANVHQLESLVDLAAELGFTNQAFSLEMSDWGMDTMRARNSAISVEHQLQIERLMALIEQGAKVGVRVSFWNPTERYRLGSPQSICPWPFERAFVSSDQRVVPCCYIGNPDVLQIGGQLDEKNTFTGVWTSDDYRSFRQAHLDGNLPKACVGCYQLTQTQ